MYYYGTSIITLNFYLRSKDASRTPTTNLEDKYFSGWSLLPIHYMCRKLSHLDYLVLVLQYFFVLSLQCCINYEIYVASSKEYKQTRRPTISKYRVSKACSICTVHVYTL
jgi:hypothetical protein